MLHKYPNIHRLSPADYNLIQETLARARWGEVDQQLLRRLARAIAIKLEHPEPAETRLRQFLSEVAAAYQRFRAERM